MTEMSPDQKSRLIDLVGDQYDVGEVIGQGGQATVYRAVHLRLNREVALKVLREDALDHSGHLARFTREIRILSVLQHPNIVRIYDSCPDHPWFSTELIQGFDIVEYCDLHSLDVRGRVELFAKVAGAIGAAHLLAITHRDLKPSNILVDLDAEPHVVDFGLACDASEAGQEWIQITITGAPIGTLPYSSPEQVAGQEAGPTSDVYALGVVFYQLLTGDLPYEISNDHAGALHNIKYADPAPNRKIPGDLWRIIRRAMQKDRTRRYPNATEFGLDLQRYLRGEPVQATDDRMYRVWKFLSRHSHAAIASFAIMVAATVGLTGLWLAERSENRANRIQYDTRVALEASALLRMGNVDRDTGRIDLAMQAFRDASKLIELSDTDDPTALGIRYRALHRLAWQSFVDGDNDEANAVCDQAISLAERMSASHPSDKRWQRHLAFSHILRGRRHATRSSWAEARRHFDSAQSGLEEITADPVDVALCARWQGRSCYELRDIEDAEVHYLRAAELSANLDGAEHVLDLVRCNIKLARCSAKRSDYRESRSRLLSAIALLDQLSDSHGLSADATALHSDATKYLNWVESKIAD